MRRSRPVRAPAARASPHTVAALAAQSALDLTQWHDASPDGAGDTPVRGHWHTVCVNDSRMIPDASPSAAAWTCPFCSLLCDEFSLDTDGGEAVLRGSACPRATGLLAAHGRRADSVAALVDGVDASVDDAVAAAASRLSTWCQPLFGGLGTDVAGARALVRLAARTGAICDHADGEALMHGLRAQQDRGQYTVTLTEVRARADLVVCVGTPAVARYPEFFHRIGLDRPDSPCRELVFLDASPPDAGAAASPQRLHEQLVQRTVVGSGDLFDDLSQLAALVAGQRLPASHPALVDLAGRLLAARYAVLVWEGGVLPAQGGLWVELLTRLVMRLNLGTRAASLALGGNDGANSVNQAFTWMTGLPLRTRAGVDGLEHEPLRFGTARLLGDAAVDGLLWISSFDPARLPPPPQAGIAPLPRIVLGPPAMRAACRDDPLARDCVFIPVATPGLNAGGHLLRTDGIVIVPLVAARADGLPGVDAVLARIGARLVDPNIRPAAVAA